jgi:hypothetical protein
LRLRANTVRSAEQQQRDVQGRFSRKVNCHVRDA